MPTYCTHSFRCIHLKNKLFCPLFVDLWIQHVHVGSVRRKKYKQEYVQAHSMRLPSQIWFPSQSEKSGDTWMFVWSYAHFIPNFYLTGHQAEITTVRDYCVFLLMKQDAFDSWLVVEAATHGDGHWVFLLMQDWGDSWRTGIIVATLRMGHASRERCLIKTRSTDHL